MSYADYLRTKQINAPKIVDKRMNLGDASTYTWRTKLAHTNVIRPTDHVITNASDPFLVQTGSKRPVVYAGSGQGGKVQDASSFTLSLGAASIGQDSFSSTKQQIGGGSGNNCLASPAPSLIINQNGNYDGNKVGLNMGSQTRCHQRYEPLSQSHFVDTLPDLQTHKIDGNLPAACTTTYTKGNWTPKHEVGLNLHSPRPVKIDFLTGVKGPQVSANGQFGRAPKVGGLIESKHLPNLPEHHGLVQGPKAVPAKFKPTTGAVAQKKIGGPQHYPVA